MIYLFCVAQYGADNGKTISWNSYYILQCIHNKLKFKYGYGYKISKQYDFKVILLVTCWHYLSIFHKSIYWANSKYGPASCFIITEWNLFAFFSSLSSEQYVASIKAIKFEMSFWIWNLFGLIEIAVDLAHINHKVTYFAPISVQLILCYSST